MFASLRPAQTALTDLCYVAVDWSVEGQGLSLWFRVRFVTGQRWMGIHLADCDFISTKFILTCAHFLMYKIKVGRHYFSDTLCDINETTDMKYDPVVQMSLA